MFSFIWGCMVVSFEAVLGIIFWIIAVFLLSSCIALIVWALKEIFGTKSGNPLGERREDEDPEEWWKEQMKDKDKWGNA